MTWRARIRLGDCHDFDVEVDAPDQITARRILERKYGRGTIIGNHVTRV